MEIAPRVKTAAQSVASDRRTGGTRGTRHQFRHIDSSLPNDLKVPVTIAQEQLGHASVSTRLNIYTHVVDTSHRAVSTTVIGPIPRTAGSPCTGSCFR